jgi:ABC-type multidrug transport system fused ATPase/permease subunit
MASTFNAMHEKLRRLGSDVTYNYPGNKSKEPAIKNLSFTIKPGQLVILVGHNGSGKTSVTKLLTRLLEPTSGTVLIDGQPAHSFKHRDLREATAFLSQDHSLFNGFSIAEDIGLGRWRAREQRELIEECLHLGGAHTVVAKLKKGSNTVLTPEPTKSSHNVEGDHPLRKLYDRLEKSNNVSGGEKQRLVA